MAEHTVTAIWKDQTEKECQDLQDILSNGTELGDADGNMLCKILSHSWTTVPSATAGKFDIQDEMEVEYYPQFLNSTNGGGII